MEDLISVIVPVYNAQKYLHRCLNSVRNQTYKNLEIILVDDGSTDKSPKICDEYARKDRRFKVIHKCNEGVSSARNIGLKLSGGEYLTFVDADDWLSQDSINILHSKIKNTEADLCCGNYYSVLVSGLRPSKFYGDKDFLADNINELAAFVGKAFSVWATLFKRKLISCEFPINVGLHEDTIFVSKYLLNCKKVATCNQEVYYYNHLSNTSLSRRYCADKCKFNANPLALRCELFHYNLPLKQQEIIVEIFIDTLNYYCQYLSLGEARVKIKETCCCFEKYLAMTHVNNLEESGNRIVSLYIALYKDIQSKNETNIYFQLASEAYSTKKSKTKNLVRKVFLPIMQFFVLKLQLGYKK